ncbi:MAG: LamG domain-containing protein [Alphaproteobacteria bacterium]|nr:LamG domain-containing protein [Alphaproteobacteria bacterium]
MAVRPDGSLTFRLSPEGEKQTVLRAEDALRDGDWADISVQFSGGMLRLSIDGVVQDEAPVAGHIGGIEGRGMILGDPFKAGIGFTGQIGELRLSANENQFASLDRDTPTPEAPLGPPPRPMAFDFDLAEALAEDPEALTLWGGALFDAADGSLELAGRDGWAFLDGGAATALEAQTTVSFAYQRDIADGSYARLIWNHHNIAIDAKDDGLSLRVGLADGSFKQYRIDDLGLNDTDRHEIMAHVNEETDLVQLIVDDVLVFSSTEDDVQLTRQDGSGASQWMIGGAWTGYFDGTISDLRLGSDPWSLDAEVQMDRFQFDPEPDGWISDLPL